MKLNNRKRNKPHVFTDSLSDIMFFLLLFFLIVSTVANPNVVKILLPKAGSTEVLSKKQITLTVTTEKRYFIDKKEYSFDELETAVQEATANVTEPTIMLRLDKDLVIQDLIDVMSIGAKLKIKMVLATDKKG
ncbi:MAG: biopolymer transporter ExbD [Saprospiraceae bacterium]|jgi:biopolymer transport protein ExbD|uniref:ExbD/TolR family protein n=1 Tax=Candidatus Brachybacter algidus TaxID=2982024 RepID=UPI001B3D397D|nr:biopolymer transporter ExbD [Candidatus Brachybacter algidus]MBP7304905.1 biopolymer transporter ExbD [Saprospiraceae bacterium]MBK6448024.1 biopolymer transporter ExbD [Candidatus Brachybacter algidus]MBK7602837.1 biopolymer transporter ExbD [Candidatus Brachybacter algidus]MBK8354505.1 biopolymer transporter ExbD [Candidatus Brachybacter algidus]MBK8750028.1 biopolymer transporter ExbD [Candidatus Brachybacter algidus]